METITDHIKGLSIQTIYGLVAVCGGVARYLNMYSSGTPFNLRMFFASTFVSGFSGYMFSLIGLSMDFPQTIVFMMAGSGGFFGDQSMKFVAEWVQKKAGETAKN